MVAVHIFVVHFCARHPHSGFENFAGLFSVKVVYVFHFIGSHLMWWSGVRTLLFSFDCSSILELK